MSDQFRSEPETVDVAPAAAADQVCAQFESACLETTDGGSAPTIEAFLGDTVEPERTALRSRLERIAEKHRQRLGDLDGSTEIHWTGVETAGPPTEGDGTVDYAPEDTVGPDAATTQPAQSAAFSLAEGIEVQAAQEGGPRVPGYEILGELGRGSMGVVYKARQRGLNRLAALKMVLAGAHAGSQNLARFHVEAQAVAALQHPNIVQIYEVGQCDGLPFFSLEFVDGGTLAEKIANKPQPAEEAARTVQTLARAMHHAHGQGIVHRDLKPGNVMLTADGQPKISDFGLAKNLEDDSVQTKSGTILGTPSYMAPEQARGTPEEVGPSADIYALGAMLYVLLTGRPPFLGVTVMETVRQVLNDEPVPPKQLQPAVPPDLETICLKCLQKEPARRYETTEALADDLRRFLRGEPILARPVSSAERFLRWCRRNPRIAALSAAVFLLLVTVAASSTYSAVAINKQRRLAEESAVAEKDAREVADQKTAEAKAALQSAFDNAKLAGDSFNQLAITVQEKLKDRPDLDDLRRGLLNDAMSGLDRVAKVGGDSVQFDRTRGGIHQRKADILMREGRTKEAFKEYEQGLAIFEKVIAHLPADNPENQIARFNAAVMCDKLGDASHQLRGDVASARVHYGKALALREGLAAGVLRAPELKPELVTRVLAGSYTKQATVALMLGEPKNAHGHLLKAVPILEKNWKSQPANAQAKQAMAGAYSMLADVSFRLRNHEARREYYEKTLVIRQELFAANPQSVQAKRDLAFTRGSLGDADLLLGNSPAALENYRRSYALHEQLHKLEPKNVERQRDLSLAHYRLGTVQQRLGASDAAAKEFQACLRLREAVAAGDAQNTHKQVDLMLAQARCGEHEKAAERAETLRKTKKNDRDLLYYAACGYALCAAAVEQGRKEITPEDRRIQERYASAALETLRQAIERGYNDVVQLETEPDLDPVRHVAGFKELLEKTRLEVRK